MFAVSGRLVLRTLDGAADLLVEELRALPSIRSIRQVSAVAVECVVDGRLGGLAACALYSTAAIPLPGRDLEVLTGLGSGIGFRVGVRDPDVRQRLIAAVEHRLGWVNRPGAWDVNLTQTDDGWCAELGPLSWARRFGALERLPWSTNLLVAEVLVRLAKVGPKDRVVDPFCGTGTILRAVRRREPSARVIGADHDPHAIAVARRNGVTDLTQAKAERLPLPAGSVDRVITNLPFGKQVGSHHANRTLYPAVLSELSRVLTPDGRAVLLTEDKRLLRQAIDHQPNLKLVRHRLLAYNGATPTAYVLTRPRRRRTR
ncbi:TRM11 family SAM-dependent methyltransferase [Kribbella sp. NPDC055071]